MMAKDETNKDENKDETSDKKSKTLSLKRTVESGQVRQSFAHGRSKAVVVEKRRKRVIKKGEGGEMMEESAAEGDEQAAMPASASQAHETLSKREQAKRMAAVEEAKKRAEREAEEAETRRIAQEEEAEQARRDKNKAAKTKDKAKENESPALDIAALEAREGKESRDGKDGKDGKETKEESEKRRQDAKPTRERRGGERRRREGKLTISNALNEEERVRSLASIKRRRERERRQAIDPASQEKVARTITIPDTITIQELANRMAERAASVIKILMQQGIMMKINDVIDADTAQLVAEDLGHSVKRVSESDVEEGLLGAPDESGAQTPRAPVVTIMGHVDHGKTSLLDKIRESKVATGEAGGITQHIGAYQSFTKSGQAVTFIDTPGHAAFTAMRARGARITDIVVLVVAGDDGVQPQTIEAIAHAKEAGAPLIVAINKMDREEADAQRVKNELLQHEVIGEEMGGEIQMVELSAKTGAGLDALLDAIILQAELMDLRANAARAAEGVVIEARIDKGRGAVATILVQRGTLRLGDIFVVGQESGRVRALVDDNAKNVKTAMPAQPVEILGLSGAPQAGEVLSVVESEARAREVADYRARKTREQASASGRVGAMEQMMAARDGVDKKELAILVKGDVQGSVEAIAHAVEGLGNEEVGARVVFAGVGGINESDITLATTANALIVGFNVRAATKARLAAESAAIEIRYYNIIYDLVDDLKAALSGMLSPDLRETALGKAQVREVFSVKGGNAAGCLVDEGQVKRGAKVRIIRDDIVIHEGELSSLRRFKDEVREVASGQECGMVFANFSELKAGDMIECYQVESISRVLEAS